MFRFGSSSFSPLYLHFLLSSSSPIPMTCPLTLSVSPRAQDRGWMSPPCPHPDERCRDHPADSIPLPLSSTSDHRGRRWPGLEAASTNKGTSRVSTSPQAQHGHKGRLQLSSQAPRNLPAPAQVEMPIQNKAGKCSEGSACTLPAPQLCSAWGGTSPGPFGWRGHIPHTDLALLCLSASGMEKGPWPRPEPPGPPPPAHSPPLWRRDMSHRGDMSHQTPVLSPAGTAVSYV